jgi:hypothetical protein
MPAWIANLERLWAQLMQRIKARAERLAQERAAKQNKPKEKS